MAKLTLTLETLGELDGGRARAIINSAISRAVADLDDRGMDLKPRKATIELTLLKDKHDRVVIDVQATAKLPSYQTAPTIANPANLPGGEIGLQFQGDAPDNPDQQTFEFPPPKQG